MQRSHSSKSSTVSSINQSISLPFVHKHHNAEMAFFAAQPGDMDIWLEVLKLDL
jgi:hypothetical protein